MLHLFLSLECHTPIPANFPLAPGFSVFLVLDERVLALEKRALVLHGSYSLSYK